jgi:hypothetical protein
MLTFPNTLKYQKDGCPDRENSIPGTKIDCQSIKAQFLHGNFHTTLEGAIAMKKRRGVIVYSSFAEGD